VSREEVENVDYEDADLDKTLGKVGAQMEKAVNWAKSVVYESVERGRGRVSPCKSYHIDQLVLWRSANE
jgi:hypothetical protein